MQDNQWDWSKRDSVCGTEFSAAWWRIVQDAVCGSAELTAEVVCDELLAEVIIVLDC
jgi:hypothetical protein